MYQCFSIANLTITLSHQVMERQARKTLTASHSSGSSSDHSSEREESPRRRTGSEDDDDFVGLPSKEEVVEDIPLTKTGFSVPPAYPPIQVRAGPLEYLRISHTI